jgi:hypothetical protein
MKNKLCLYSLVIVLFQCFSLCLQAQPDSAAVAKALKPVADAINTKLNTLDSAGKKMENKIDSIHKDDSATRKAVNASFSKALEKWKGESKKHYEKTFGSFGFLISLSILLMLVFGYLLAKYSAICRDESYDPATHLLKTDVHRRPFSYSRVQCLWWTLIIFSCYTAVCIYFLELLPLNATVIILLGGGLSVSVFGKVIDNNQIQEGTVLHNRNQDIKDSEGFFIDILSDDSGVSVHRLQALLFNIIFGIGFIMACITKVENQLYPFADFEVWQFTLLGISAAGYLGMKAGENGKGSEAARTAQAANAAGGNEANSNMATPSSATDAVAPSRDEANYQ